MSESHAISPDEHHLAIDRAKLEGRRMAHLADKAKADAKNFREAASLMPNTPRGNVIKGWLTNLADRLEAVEPSEPNTSANVKGSHPPGERQ